MGKVRKFTQKVNCPISGRREKNLEHRVLTTKAKVEVVEFVGSTVILEVATASQKFVLVVDSDSNVKAGQVIDIFFDINKMCLFDCENERLID